MTKPEFKNITDKKILSIIGIAGFIFLSGYFVFDKLLDMSIIGKWLADIGLTFLLFYGGCSVIREIKKSKTKNRK